MWFQFIIIIFQICHFVVRPPQAETKHLSNGSIQGGGGGALPYLA